MTRRPFLSFLFTGSLLFLGAYLTLFQGVVSLTWTDVWQAVLYHNGDEATRYIVCGLRLPRLLTAICCGGGLAASGLLLQTCFHNPLADTGILGISAGASLGVAAIMLGAGGTLTLGMGSIGGFTAIILAAFAGSAAVLALLLALSSILRNGLTLLIVGIMVSYVTSSLISLLNSLSTAEGIHSYIFWGLGDFGGVSKENLPLFVTATALALTLALTLAKPLNALLLGEDYAQSMGISVRGARYKILLVTGLLTALSTAFCGPITFLGLATPHIARLLLGREDHHLMLPFTMLLGAALALLSGWLCLLPGDDALLPLNVITPLWGVPVILCVLLFKRKS